MGLGTGFGGTALQLLADILHCSTSPGNGGSSGGGPYAHCIALGVVESGLVSQSASGHSPLPSPVPEGSGHRPCTDKVHSRGTAQLPEVFQ